MGLVGAYGCIISGYSLFDVLLTGTETGRGLSMNGSSDVVLHLVCLRRSVRNHFFEEDNVPKMLSTQNLRFLCDLLLKKLAQAAKI